MIISNFSANISTLNFGTDKETQVVHDTLHAKGITTISELCHLSKKHIEALGLDPSLMELHLKKNGLSLGMCDNEILQHQRIASELLKKNDEMPLTNESDADIQAKQIIGSFYDHRYLSVCLIPAQSYIVRFLITCKNSYNSVINGYDYRIGF